MNERVDIEKHINEMTDITNVLRFLVKMRWQYHLQLPRNSEYYDELFCYFLDVIFLIFIVIKYKFFMSFDLCNFFFVDRWNDNCHWKLTLKWKSQGSNPGDNIWPCNFDIFANRVKTYGRLMQFFPNLYYFKYLRL